jgi:hypothetical protein
MAPYGSRGVERRRARTKNCVMYNFGEDKQVLDASGAITEALDLEVTNCLHTLEASR